MSVRQSSIPPMPNVKCPKCKESDVEFEVSDIEIEWEIENDNDVDSMQGSQS